jgi:hypothetical protein
VFLVSTSTGRQTADAQLVTGNGFLTAIMVEADGTNAATVELHDGTGTSGTLLAKIIVDATLTNEAITFPHPVRFNTGLYLNVTGTGCGATIHYSRG